ncbi:TadE/TadG family type IV pilus assembly protein [Phenylobacterium sp.]|uniref:TadE/TadG family type IV pilus assembly protein n=1 Tax=Phenylobacterium sp. TaxID=1871053 RepID=UPI002C085808|nr:TadE/TadG family type IV pilus assembly protein [Phenylobacterium sp.]HVI31065.1 TadE/TadG family type IV pilus assembly protein [Phenylobacterium sp.]
MSARRPMDCEAGGALVEFALLAPLFLGLLLGALQHGIAGMVSASFDNAVLSAGRHIRTGQPDGTGSAAAFKALVCRSMLDPEPTCLARLHVDVRPLDRFAEAEGVLRKVDPDEDGFTNGGPGAIMLVTATYDWPMFTPFLGDGFSRAGPGAVRMTVRQIFRNEPYR